MSGTSFQERTSFISLVLLPSKPANTALPSLLGVRGIGEDDLLCTGVFFPGAGRAWACWWTCPAAGAWAEVKRCSQKACHCWHCGAWTASETAMLLAQLCAFWGGWFTSGRLTLCGLWRGWIQQRRAGREFLLAPVSACGTFFNGKKNLDEVTFLY